MTDSDLTELRNQCLTSLYLCFDNVSKYIETDKTNEHQKLITCVEEYCVIEAKQENAPVALEMAKRKTKSSNEEYYEHFKKQLEELVKAKLLEQRHPYLCELDKYIKKDRELSKASLNDSDLAITASQDVLLDPVTKKPIEDPVKHTICGHIYEKSVILNLINAKSRVKCPVAGCGNRDPIQKQHLVSDEELKFRMKLTQHSTMVHERSVLDLDVSS